MWLSDTCVVFIRDERVEEKNLSGSGPQNSDRLNLYFLLVLFIPYEARSHSVTQAGLKLGSPPALAHATTPG